jgi:DNA alkylation damage repair protein AlkB
MQQLRSLLRYNRRNRSQSPQITHVLGCCVDTEDEDTHKKLEEALARTGAVVLRNLVSREIDQLAFGALALRPLAIHIPDEVIHLDLTEKKICKKVEEIKSRISIPANSPIIVQTNFGPQLLSQSSTGTASKKRKIDAFSLSKLRYLNLGEWNYNWGDRRYDRIPDATPFPASFSMFAKEAHQLAQQQCLQSEQLDQPQNNSLFDMAICNFYHLQRPSDRLGGHKDDVESDLTSPLITISLGAPGIFLLGGKSRSCLPTAILLKAGDCMVMSGESRQYFHGVPTILKCEDDSKSQGLDVSFKREVFPELKEDLLRESAASFRNGGNEKLPSCKELLFMKAFLSTARMNISIRRI